MMLNRPDLISGVAVFKIISTVVFVPVYCVLIQIFATKADFKGMIAYKIITTIGLMDCFFLIQNLIAGILALAWNDVTWKCTNAVLEAMTFADVGLAASQCVMCQVGEFFACMRAGYLEAVPFLFLVLALNRLAVMLEFKRKRIVDILCSILMLMACFIFLPFTLILHYLISTKTDKTDDIKFLFYLDSFGYNGPSEFMSVMGYFGPSMEVAAFFVTILAAIVILVQKIKFGVAFKISPIEIRLLVQGILIMVPMSFVSVTGLTLSTEMNSIPAFYVIWHLINALIPVVNLLVWVVFNPAARWHLLKVFKEKPTKNFSKPVSNVVTVAARSSADSRI